jgi:hypothetical protein
MLKKISFVTLLLIALTLQAQSQKKINVLFLGNSLTYTNNLPELMKLVASCDSVEMTYRSICFPNYALIDHWNDGNAQKEIQSGKYNFVIVQQGPSSQSEGRVYLLDYGLKFDSLCDRHKSKLVSYMVWPAKARSIDFQGVFESYKLLADSTKGIFAPAGNAWLKVWEGNPEFKLYGEDNFHPHYNGSLLAAMVIYGSIMKGNSFTFISHSKIQNLGIAVPDFYILKRATQSSLTKKKTKKT